MIYLAKRKVQSPEIDEIVRIRKYLSGFNDLHQRNIREQLDLSLGKLEDYVKNKIRFLRDYIENLRKISNDDVGQALLDNLDDELRSIRSLMINILEDIQNFDGDSELQQANFIFNKIGEFLTLSDKLGLIERTISTHIGDTHTKEN